MSTPKSTSPYLAHTKQYPLIFFPAFVQQAHHAEPPPPSPPPAPMRPRKLVASKRWITVPSGAILGLVFLNVLVGYSIMSGWLAFLLLILTPPLAYFGLYRYAGRLLLEQHARALREYQLALADYEIKKQQHKSAAANYQTEAAIKAFRYQLVIQKMKALTSEPRRLRRSVARGRSEEQFYNYLVRHFGKAYIRKSMQLGEFERPYAPDFCYIDASTGMHIDIEIDEPYAALSKEPIHYKGADADRNAFFTQHGWLVLRFAEEQITKYPEACCTQIEAARQFALYLAEDLPCHVPQVPHWSRAEAEKMAQLGSRSKL